VLKEGIMRKTFCFVLAVFLCSATLTHAGLLDDVIKGADTSSRAESDDSTIASGLKEALSIGTEKAVKNVSQVDGYFGNQVIKILMPEKIQKVADVLRKIGYQKEVDDFVLSMNRAAEKAAPKAMSFFVDAIKGMTFEDARGILNGGDTSATDFFKRKTHDNIYNTFKPVIASSMDEVGVTRSYKEMMGKYETIPFMSKESVDLDHYVTTKAMDGLFYMVGQEEKKIRTDPAARVTDLLKNVFGK
jgi:RNA binding exosome subunit